LARNWVSETSVLSLLPRPVGAAVVLVRVGVLLLDGCWLFSSSALAAITPM
jgi:hypothetical protein